MKTLILTICLMTSFTAFADLIPGYKSSGNNELDKALFHLYHLHHAPKCLSVEDSYEYIAPRISQALEEQPELLTDYLMPLPFTSLISEFHLKDLYEYQLAKVEAFEKVVEKRENRSVEFSRLEQLDFAMNDAVFRRIVAGESMPRDILQFSWKQNSDGTVEREVRWVANEWGIHRGEKTLLLKKKVFVEWSIEVTSENKYLVKINDLENAESLNLVLEKKVVEKGKPAQWSLTDQGLGLQFLDYFTDFCADPKHY